MTTFSAHVFTVDGPLYIHEREYGPFVTEAEANAYVDANLKSLIGDNLDHIIEVCPSSKYKQPAVNINESDYR